jgi:HSP20 family protein
LKIIIPVLPRQRPMIGSLSRQDDIKSMSLIKWTPFLDMEPFEEMEKMLSNWPGNRAGAQGYMPAIDMYEDKDNVIVEAQLAGIDPEQVDITIENDVLCLKGESEQKREVEEKNYYRKEIRRGNFYRSVQLPAHVQGDQASAAAADGVLKITIPKAPEAKPKTIKIQTSKK